MRSNAACFDELRSYLENTPLVDCHDHSVAVGPKYKDPLQVVINGYFPSDILSVAGPKLFAEIADTSRPWEERWALFEPVWRRCCHTGYAQVSRRVLDKFYGEREVTLEALKRIDGKLLDLDQEDRFDAILADAKIAVRLLDIGIFTSAKDILNGTQKTSPRGRHVISLPGWHDVRSAETVYQRAATLDRTVTCLDEYLALCREVFETLKARGAVAFKDQSAYSRSLAFGNPTRSDAEAVFNKIMIDHRVAVSYPEGLRPLDDFLFHEFMRMARDMDLPVQLHTGHMAGNYNDVCKANVALMAPVFELHRETRFDLFHVNWPYSGDLLFLAKNYPNVHIDFCWANIVDPVYCQNLFKQVLSAVPHGKVHGYGSDFLGCADRAWAHASIARDNMAIALAEMVETGYLGLDNAKEVAHMWLFDNANEFFKLGLTA